MFLDYYFTIALKALRNIEKSSKMPKIPQQKKSVNAVLRQITIFWHIFKLLEVYL